MEGGGPNFGWTFYAPLSTTYAPDTVNYFIFGVHIMGASSIMGSINIIATVMNMRAPGMTYMKMPMFVWTWLITAFLLVAVMPVLAGAVTMMLMDINFGTSFFDAAGGGDPVCSSTYSGSLGILRFTLLSCQHLVWFLRLSQHLVASLCLVILQWSMPQHRLRLCRLSYGRTTCLP